MVVVQHRRIACGLVNFHEQAVVQAQMLRDSFAHQPHDVPRTGNRGQGFLRFRQKSCVELATPAHGDVHVGTNASPDQAGLVKERIGTAQKRLPFTVREDDLDFHAGHRLPRRCCQLHRQFLRREETAVRPNLKIRSPAVGCALGRILSVGQPQQLLSGAIGGHLVVVRITGDDDRDRQRIHQRLQFLPPRSFRRLAGEQRSRHILSLGDVPEIKGQSLIGRVTMALEPKIEWLRVIILKVGGLAGLDRAVILLELLGVPCLGEELPDAAAKDLLRAPAKDPRRLFAEISETPIAVEHREAVADVVEHSLQLLVGPA